MAKAVKILNTMTRQVEDFVPVHAGQVGMYACGPTVYSEPHIGNTRTAMLADLLRKMFALAGYDVLYVSNITDVGHLVGDSDDGDDKIEKMAKSEQMSVEQIVKKYTDIYFLYNSWVNIDRPSVVCPATDHIKEQIDFIKVLEQKGFTYKTSDGIYFDTSKDPNYGKLARIDIAGLRAGERIDMKEKRNETDFALWKFSTSVDGKRLQEWDSPWGVGFPGWHIECSAMSIKYLGERFDIHVGGTDIMPTHHINEEAQNCAYCGFEGTVKYWVHGGMLVLPGGNKMAKSSGHKQTLKSELVDKGIAPLAFRYLCLTAHFSTQLVFSETALKDSEVALKRLQAKTLGIKKEAGKSAELGEKGNEIYDKISGFLFNNLDCPQALVAFREMLETDLNAAEKLYIIEKIDSVFCLDLLKEIELEIPEEVQILLDERAVARLEKNFAESDRLRDEIAKLGFIVKDGKEGQTIEKK